MNKHDLEKQQAQLEYDLAHPVRTFIKDTDSIAAMVVIVIGVIFIVGGFR